MRCVWKGLCGAESFWCGAPFDVMLLFHVKIIGDCLNWNSPVDVPARPYGSLNFVDVVVLTDSFLKVSLF